MNGTTRGISGALLSAVAALVCAAAIVAVPADGPIAGRLALLAVAAAFFAAGVVQLRGERGADRSDTPGGRDLTED